MSAHQSAINVHILTTLTNRSNIPIYLGATKPISGHEQCEVWPGHGIRGTGLHQFEEDLEHAAQYYSSNSNPIHGIGGGGLPLDKAIAILDPDGTTCSDGEKGSKTVPPPKPLDARDLAHDTDMSIYGVDTSKTASEALVEMVKENPDFYGMLD